ncbi:MAG TPA: hypothetical protein VLB29_18475 [Nocardioidaceae bacterium]|nr:hypothetical protein [Nocardioidaceae bacterium]
MSTPEAYDAALDPLKKRSDVLEDQFAAVQGDGYTGPDQVRDVLAEILPEFAALLEETRAIAVEDPALERAHAVLVASLERQQEGLERALKGLEEGDMVMVAEGGRALQDAERLLKQHRRLLSRARAGS